ncbi:MAG TPA: Trp biosynthesis-associated membrane protein, partial [Phycicoccus sp.]
MRRLSSKGVVVLLALLGATGLLVSAFRPWVTGAVDDAVLGATRISATGAEVAPGLSAVALAIAAAAVAAVAAGRVARIIAL